MCEIKSTPANWQHNFLYFHYKSVKLDVDIVDGTRSKKTNSLLSVKFLKFTFQVNRSRELLWWEFIFQDHCLWQKGFISNIQRGFYSGCKDADLFCSLVALFLAPIDIDIYIFFLFLISGNIILV